MRISVFIWSGPNFVHRTFNFSVVEVKFIKELSEKFKPKNIICFSTKEYSEYFERTFFNENEKIEFQFDSIELKNGKKGNIKIYKNGVLNVIVIPFLGRGNLASYEEVRMMTNYLKEKYI